MNTVSTEFFSVEVWFTDQVVKHLKLKIYVNLPLIIEWTLLKWDIQQNQNTENSSKDMAFCYLPENLVIKMVKKLMHTATTTTTKNAAKTAFKKDVQKTAKTTGDLIGNKIADKIASDGKSKEDNKTKKVEEI